MTAGSSSSSSSIERITEAADLDAVAAVEAASFSNPWTREMLERELRDSGVARVYALRSPAGGIAAFCTCWFVLDELHINTIAVDPPSRRSGLARRLMLDLMRLAAAEGMRRILLEVRRSNEPAQRLYQGLGFAIAGTRRGYYTHPVEDALVLTRQLLRETPEPG
jgi:ribosomal-protein-alanine N-acetyltransferase